MPQPPAGPVSVPDQAPLTYFLQQWYQGTEQALDEILERVYGELKATAIHYMRSERADHTLSPTAVIHEVYLRLVSGERLHFENRARFFAFAGKVIRHVLAEYGRGKRRLKRGGAVKAVSLEGLAFTKPTCGQRDLGEILAVDQALLRLAELDDRQARIVELRFFAGLTFAEIADLLQLSLSTVNREWRLARLWFARQWAEAC